MILGEFRRALDERHRITLPSELVGPLLAGETACVLAKERPGALSVWKPEVWQRHLDRGVAIVEAKLAAGRLDDRLERVQAFGRLLSTRHRTVPVAGRGRLLIPPAFREFLGVEPGGETLVLGAALCLEIWQPAAWLKYLEIELTGFRELYDELSA